MPGDSYKLPFLPEFKWGTGPAFIEEGLGLKQPTVTPTALDFTQANQTRDIQTALMAQLQQAAAGNGPSVAQGMLRQATDDQMANAMALGAAQQGQGLGYAGALRQIANQRARIGQQSAGQAALLRAQEQQDATRQLGQFSLGVRGQDQSQTGMTGQNAFGYAALNSGIQQQNAANRRNLVGNLLNPLGWIFGQAGLGGKKGEGGNNLQVPDLEEATPYARGGKVPGYSNGGQIDGTEGRRHLDNPANDKVLGALTPGEVVLPLSVVTAPDWERRTLAFIRAAREEEPYKGPHPLIRMAEQKKRKAA